MIDPFRLRLVNFESLLERQWATVFIARSDLKEIREQQSCTYFSNRRHTFDFIVERMDGTRVAYAVKYEEDVTPELEGILEVIASEHGSLVADEFRILTEKDLNLIQLNNSRHILDCGLDFEAQSMVEQYLNDAPRHLCLQQIADDTGLGSDGYRAAVAMMFSRKLRLNKNERLCRTALVENTFKKAA